MTRSLPDLVIEPVVRLALAEDLGRCGDVTAQACIPEDARFSAVFCARQAGVMAGGAVVRIAVHALDPQATVTVKVADGEAFEAGAVLVAVEANARALLAAERTALNLLLFDLVFFRLQVFFILFFIALTACFAGARRTAVVRIKIDIIKIDLRIAIALGRLTGTTSTTIVAIGFQIVFWF